MIRRRGFGLPYADQVPALVEVVRGSGTVEGGERFVDAALAHGLAGHLSAAIETGRARVGDADRSRVAQTAALRLAVSRALRHELAGLGPALGEATGATPVCVKGPAVADRLYEHPDLRTFADLDLLVPRSRLGDGTRALVERDWVQVHEFSAEFASTHGHDVHLRRRAGGVTLRVELHWRIGDDPTTVVLDHELLSRRAQPLPRTSGALAPAPEPELLVLAIHLLSDRERRLRWIQDLALASDALDDTQWGRAFELADELGLSWALHRALDYPVHHLGWHRPRPSAPGPPPAFGPLRAVEALDMRGSLHVGRLAAMPWRERPGYLRRIAIPTREGLRGVAGDDDAPTWRLVGRHLQAAALGLLPRRR